MAEGTPVLLMYLVLVLVLLVLHLLLMKRLLLLHHHLLLLLLLVVVVLFTVGVSMTDHPAAASTGCRTPVTKLVVAVRKIAFVSKQAFTVLLPFHAHTRLVIARPAKHPRSAHARLLQEHMEHMHLHKFAAVPAMVAFSAALLGCGPIPLFVGTRGPILDREACHLRGGCRIIWTTYGHC